MQVIERGPRQPLWAIVWIALSLLLAAVLWLVIATAGSGIPWVTVALGLGLGLLLVVSLLRAYGAITGVRRFGQRPRS